MLILHKITLNLSVLWVKILFFTLFLCFLLLSQVYCSNKTETPSPTVETLKFRKISGGIPQDKGTCRERGLLYTEVVRDGVVVDHINCYTVWADCKTQGKGNPSGKTAVDCKDYKW